MDPNAKVRKRDLEFEKHQTNPFFKIKKSMTKTRLKCQQFLLTKTRLIKLLVSWTKIKTKMIDFQSTKTGLNKISMSLTKCDKN